MCGTPYLAEIRSPCVPFPAPGGESMMTRIRFTSLRSARSPWPDAAQVLPAGPRAGPGAYFATRTIVRMTPGLTGGEADAPGVAPGAGGRSRVRPLPRLRRLGPGG